MKPDLLSSHVIFHDGLFNDSLCISFREIPLETTSRVSQQADRTRNLRLIDRLKSESHVGVHRRRDEFAIISRDIQSRTDALKS